MLTERRIVKETMRYFQALNYETSTEVPLFENRIDIVAYTKNLSHLIAVEAKVDKWFRALQQAVLYRICADEVYIALGEQYVHRVNLDLLRQLGIGLLSVNRKVEEVINSGQGKYITHDSVRKAVINSILMTSGWSHAEKG